MGKEDTVTETGVSAGCPFARVVQYRLVSGQFHVNGRGHYFYFLVLNYLNFFFFNYGVCE